MPSTYVPLNATLGFKASPVNGLWFNIFGGYRISKDELFAIWWMRTGIILLISCRIKQKPHMEVLN